MRVRTLASSQLSFDDLRRLHGRGGPRRGAGRPRGARARVPHRGRDDVAGSDPMQLTLRIRRDLPSLRSGAFVREFRTTLREACERREFRVLHYSVQRDHVHPPSLDEAVRKPPARTARRGVVCAMVHGLLRSVFSDNG